MRGSNRQGAALLYTCWNQFVCKSGEAALHTPVPGVGNYLLLHITPPSTCKGFQVMLENTCQSPCYTDDYCSTRTRQGCKTRMPWQQHSCGSAALWVLLHPEQPFAALALHECPSQQAATSSAETSAPHSRTVCTCGGAVPLSSFTFSVSLSSAASYY